MSLPKECKKIVISASKIKSVKIGLDTIEIEGESLQIISYE